MTQVVPLCEPTLAGNESAYLQECIESGMVSSTGPFVDRFEQAFAAWVGSEYAVACASGTAALHIALILAGAGPGSIVPVSTFTFLASVNAISYTGATPLLVDSCRSSWNMDTGRLHEYIRALADRGQPLPPAIEVVHILGHPADLEPLCDLRVRYGIVLIEDAAEALGALVTGGRSVGTVGDLGCFSFNGNKILTAGGGGMIVTNDPAHAARAKHLTTQAKLPGRAYLHDEIGYNYRLTNVAAAIGLAQLEQLDGFLERKRAIAQQYVTALRERAVEFQEPHADTVASHWLTSALVPDGQRDIVVGRLNDVGFGARPIWCPAHEQTPYLASPRLGGEVAEELGRRGLSLPSSVGLHDDQVDDVCRELVW
jgi:dTDP-4-amino-4,6-dideoxygalactose transaminase